MIIKAVVYSQGNIIQTVIIMIAGYEVFRAFGTYGRRKSFGTATECPDDSPIHYIID